MKIIIRSIKKIDRLIGIYKAKLYGIKIHQTTRVSARTRYLETENAKVIIGANSVVHPYAILAPNKRGSIVIGENSSVNPYSIIYGHGGTQIGNRTRSAANCIIIPANHNFEFDERGVYRDTGITKFGITIGDDVWIGAGCTNLDGLSICNRCIIAARSVVNSNRSVPGLYAGVPATLKRELSEGLIVYKK